MACDGVVGAGWVRGFYRGAAGGLLGANWRWRVRAAASMMVVGVVWARCAFYAVGVRVERVGFHRDGPMEIGL